MSLEIRRVFVFMLTGFLLVCLVTSDPVPYRRGNNDAETKLQKKLGRYKRDGESRQCVVSPTYLPPTAIDTGDRLKQLRQQMESQNLTAFIIPSEDAHQSEYIADHDKRRQYISGFTGSSGLAIVTMDEAALWTDSRYWLQADMELDCNWLLMKSGEPDIPSPDNWLIDTLNPGDNVGFDATLMSIDDYFSYNNTFESAKEVGPILVDVSNGNLIDIIWSADTENPQPSYPNEPLQIMAAEIYTGETWQQKIWQFLETKSIRGQLLAYNADALVVTKLDEIAWMFNLRGKDIPYNPMFVSNAIVTTNSIQLYLYDMDTRLTDAIRTHLGFGASGCEGDECVTVKNYDQFLGDLRMLSRDMIWISDRSSYAVYVAVPQEKRLIAPSPILLMKAVKSDTEITGMNSAHFKDSVALCQLGAWMQETMDELEDPINGDIDVISELIVEQKAEEFRSVQPDFQGLSFHSISGFGPHAALNHYSSSEETNVPITNTSTFLFDSGSQYRDGSCDITRTFHFGKPTPFMIEAYTRVLIGHINLANGVFRSGIYGRDIDALAREPLWRNGLDFKHGTGHGVGHFLNIHEDPINIANYPGEEPIDLNVCVSDEPGYYQDGEFGIRIEDVMCSVEANTKYKFSSYTYMTWKMASLVPLEPNLVDFTLFSNRQLDWYNAYNLRIREEIGPALQQLDDKKAAYNWMKAKTKPMKYKFVINGHGEVSGGDDSFSTTAVIITVSVTIPTIAVVVGFGIWANYNSKRKKDKKDLIQEWNDNAGEVYKEVEANETNGV